MLDFEWKEMDVWERLHRKCLAVRALALGEEPPIGVAPEVWKITLLGAVATLNAPLEDDGEE